ncbi:MAG: succinate dehydrogenase, cytochrome b556 subunit [Candidatus Puniceispirillaceae bacterium]|jgi:fumarate reductase subunit D
MIRPHRTHALWYAFLLHRVSGIALALFLPLHFYMLSLALTDPAQLDGFLVFTDLLIVKCAEFALVFLLAVHMFGGLRLMALEFLPWSPRQKTFAASAVALAFLISTSFFLQAM